MQALIGEKEKRVVLDDRTPDRTAILVLVERRGPGRKPGARVHEGISIEFKCVSMEGIRSVLDGGVNDRAGIPAVLGIESVGDHAKLANRVRIGDDQSDVQYRIIGVVAVDQKRVLLRFRTVAGKAP